MTEHQPIPVHGYKPQDDATVGIVNNNKMFEEQILRILDALKAKGTIVDQRWLAIGRTHIEQGFMAINRAIFKPNRVQLPSDVNNGD